MSSDVSSAPASNRIALLKKIESLPEEDAAVVEQVLARLEMDRLWKELRAGFADDWAKGKYDRLDEVIREVRADLRRRAA
jgi:hypothetical protein